MREEGRRKREEGRGKREEGRRKREEGRGKREEGRGSGCCFRDAISGYFKRGFSACFIGG